MTEYIYFIPIILIIFLLNNFLIKKKLLLNITGEPHQSLTSKTKIPLLLRHDEIPFKKSFGLSE